MNGSSYTPGGWTALRGDGWVVLLEPDAGDEVALELWRQCLRGATFVDGLSVLSRAGLGALPSFALAVRGTDGSTNVAVRGPVRVEAVTEEGTTVVDGSAVSTWSERVLPAVHRLTAQVSGAPSSPQLPLLGGWVRAAGLTVPARLDLVGPGVEEPTDVDEPVAVAAHQDGAAQPQDDPVAELDGEPVGPEAVVASWPDEPVPTLAAAPLDDDPAAEAVDEPAVDDGSVPETVALAAEEHPWDRPTQVLHAVLDPALEPVLEPGPAPELDRLRDAALDMELDAVPEAAADQVLDPVLDPAREPAMASAGVPTEAIGGLPVAPSYESADDASFTIMSSSLADLRESLPVWDGRPAPTGQTPPPSGKLVLSTGLVVALDRPVLLGRAPQASRIGGRDLPRLVAVPSPQQDISRTHAEVRVVGEDVLVTDLDSTNGVYLLAAGLGAQRLHPGEPTVLGLDQTVDLGDGVTFTVERGT